VPTKRRGSNRTATGRVPLVGPNEPKPTWSGRGDPIAKKGAERQRTTGHRGQGEQAHQGRRKKRPPPKAQAASLVSAVTPLLSSATPLAPPAPHDDRLSVPSVRSRCRRCTRSCRAQAALLRRGCRRGGPVSHALSFFSPSRALSSVLGPELGDRVCSVHEV
jgi:hypothetical protein